VGSSVVRALGLEAAVDEILGLARRLPALRLPKVEWASADVAGTDLVALFRGADAVVHLAWLIQPARDEATTRRTNVDGSERVMHAVAKAGVPALVYASSVGAYSPGPKDRRVDESWPTDGISSLFYSRHKAEVERLLDRFEAERPEVTVTRLRPGLTFKRAAASGIRRLFAGPFLPSPLVRPGLIGAVPDVANLCFQAVHSVDVGDAYRRAVLAKAPGPFNIAAEPVLDPAELGRLLDARPIGVPARGLRGAADAAYRLRLTPTPPGWLDLALSVPLMDTGRARSELGWVAEHSSGDALLELLAGLRDGAGMNTPPLAADTGGPARLRELLTGVGRR